MAATNKYLAQMNKSGTAGKATKKARNPASRVDPMGADHRVVPAIRQAFSLLPQPWSQRAMLTSNDYKELAARCTELASESSEPTVAEALGRLRRIISRVPPSCTTNSRLDDASALSGHPSSPWQRRTNVWRTITSPARWARRIRSETADE